MASPGSVNSKQIHDPKEEKLVTNQKKRVQYLFRDLKWRGGRRSFEVWESDGGNVPAEEEVYLINGQLKRGKVAFLQHKIHTLWKQMKTILNRPASSSGV